MPINPPWVWDVPVEDTFELPYISQTFLHMNLYMRQADPERYEEDQPNTVWLGTGSGSGQLFVPPLAYHEPWYADESVTWTYTAVAVVGTGIVDDMSWRDGFYDPPPPPTSINLLLLYQNNPAVMTVEGPVDEWAFPTTFEGGEVHLMCVAAEIQLTAPSDATILANIKQIFQDDPAIVNLGGAGATFFGYDDGAVVPSSIPSGSFAAATGQIRVYRSELSPTVDPATYPVLTVYYPTGITPITDSSIIPMDTVVEFDCWSDFDYAIIPADPPLPPYEPPAPLPPDDTPVDPGSTHAPSGLHIKALRTIGVKMEPPAGYTNGNPHS